MVYKNVSTDKSRSDLSSDETTASVYESGYINTYCDTQICHFIWEYRAALWPEV